MSIIYNGVEIKKLVYNGTEIKALYYGSTKVFSSLDPTSMNFTQDEFIEICNNNLQSKMKLGAKITLNNTYGSTYEVIGVNHDGTSNTVDIMATTQVGNMAFGESNNDYRNSTVRSWLVSTYYDAFANVIRNIAKTMVVKYATALNIGVNLNDKVKLLSAVELNYDDFNRYMPGYSSYKEGEPYTVFTKGNYDASVANRWRPAGSYGNSSYYWLRSKYTNSASTVWIVGSNGGSNNAYNCGSSRGVLPVLRF